VDVFNSLVKINNDRIEGYGYAAKETDDSDLMGLFNEMADRSRKLNQTLIDKVREYGGNPAESTTSLGEIYRVWMDFKSAITGKDRKAILSSCEFGEDAAQKTYESALKSDYKLPSDVLELISDQKAKLEQDHNRVKKLRDAQ
jgi:uncharacterized protein (TIGR02284 family)